MSIATSWAEAGWWIAGAVLAMATVLLWWDGHRRFARLSNQPPGPPSGSVARGSLEWFATGGIGCNSDISSSTGGADRTVRTATLGAEHRATGGAPVDIGDASHGAHGADDGADDGARGAGSTGAGERS